MDCVMTNKHYKYGSKMEGAIMMSNTATKQECHARKLFGLPHDKIKFAEKIKAGMLLFLFEYEERMLYGVFEATTDGAMNIVPNAFFSSGKSFPAQVRFRRVWMCRPLSEDEFCPAIIDNYYSPKKFHFDLSYDQVFKLVQMFSLRRINVTQDLKYVPNEIVRMFQKDNFVRRNPKPHFTHPGRQSHYSKASLDSSTSSMEISPQSQDHISNADSSNSTDEIFERYDPDNPAITSLQKWHNGNKTSSPLSDEYFKLRSDIEPARTSVFSRLSVHPTAEKKRKDFWADDRSIMTTQSKRLEHDMKNKRPTAEFVAQESVVDVDAFIEECIAEARPDLKLIREAEMNGYAESGTDDGNGYDNKKSLASGNSEKSSLCHKKEVKSRNLLWFLEKPVDGKVKQTEGSSHGEGGYETAEVNDESSVR